MLLALLLLAAVIFGAAAEIPKVPGGDFEAHELVLEGEKKITLYTGPGEVFKTRNQLTPGTKVMSFGTEDGYTLICYEAGKHQYRFAWVRGVLDERLSPAKHEKTQVIRKSSMTDDPLGRQKIFIHLPVGQPVRVLGRMGEWSYVETEGAVRNRGFIQSERLGARVTAVEDMLYPFREDDRMGYMDAKGKTVIDAAYRFAGEFRNGYAVVVLEDGSEGIIDREGKTVIDPKEGWSFSEGYDGGYYGGRDTGVIIGYRTVHVSAGEEKAEQPEEKVEQPEEKVEQPEEKAEQPEEKTKQPEEKAEQPEEKAGQPEEKAKQPEENAKQPEGKAGQEAEREEYAYFNLPTGLFLENATGEAPWIRPEDEVILMADGRLVNRNTGLQVLRVDPSEVPATGITVMRENRVIVGNETSGFRMISSSGRKTQPPAGLKWMAGVNCSGDRVALVSAKSGKWGFTDSNGRQIVRTQYDEVGTFSDGLCRVRNGKEWSYIGKTGKKVSALSGFEEAWDFEMGVAVVKKDGQRQLVNKKGNVLASGLDWFVLDRENQLLLMRYPDGLKVMTTEGTVVFDSPMHLPDEEELGYSASLCAPGFTDGLLPVMDSASGKMGYVNLLGQVVIPCTYDLAAPFRDGLAWVTSGDTERYISTAGETVREFPAARGVQDGEQQGNAV